MVISENAVTSNTDTTIKPLVNADSPQVWESPHAELKKEFIFTFENSWTDSKNQEEPASVSKGVWLAHTPWAFLNARRRKHSPVGLAVIPSSSLTGSVSLCSGILSPCLLKPKNNPHSTAQSCNNWKANLSLVCSAHCRWLVLNELRVVFENCAWEIVIDRSDDFYSLFCMSTESIKV